MLKPRERLLSSMHSILPLLCLFCIHQQSARLCSVFDAGLKGRGLRAAEDLEVGKLVAEYVGTPFIQAATHTISTCIVDTCILLSSLDYDTPLSKQSRHLSRQVVQCAPVSSNVNCSVTLLAVCIAAALVDHTFKQRQDLCNCR